MANGGFFGGLLGELDRQQTRAVAREKEFAAAQAADRKQQKEFAQALELQGIKGKQARELAKFESGLEGEREIALAEREGQLDIDKERAKATAGIEAITNMFGFGQQGAGGGVGGGIGGGVGGGVGAGVGDSTPTIKTPGVKDALSALQSQLAPGQKVKLGPFDITGGTGVETAQQLRKEFNAQPAVKVFKEIGAKVASMDALLNNAKDGALDINNALDQALISLFNKITDPGSVVRESEFARTAANLPVLNRVIGAIGKFKQGGPGLTKQDREDLVIAAKIIANEQVSAFNEQVDFFNDLSDIHNVDRRKVFGSKGVTASPFDIQSAVPPDDTTTVSGSTPGGNTFRRK